MMGDENAWPLALEADADAYTLHPRDRDASSALRRLAKKALEDYPGDRTMYATQMAEFSKDYLATYAPVKKYAVVKSTEGDSP